MQQIYTKIQLLHIDCYNIIDLYCWKVDAGARAIDAIARRDLRKVMVLPAGSVSPPHQRHNLYFVSVQAYVK